MNWWGQRGSQQRQYSVNVIGIIGVIVMLLVVTVEAFQSGAGSSRQEQDCFEFPQIEINIV